MSMTQQRYEEMGRGDTCAAPMERDAGMRDAGMPDVEVGAVVEQMRRFEHVGMRLEKAAVRLADRLGSVVLAIPSDGCNVGATPCPPRCEHAAHLSLQIDHLEYVAGRLEELRASIDL